MFTRILDSVAARIFATEPREHFIPDFSHWEEHDQFEAAFAPLLNDPPPGGASAITFAQRSRRSALSPRR